MLQELFEKVAIHLLTQNKKSERFSYNDSQWICAYRGEENTKCAIGCLINDIDYIADFEGSSLNPCSKIWNYLENKNYTYLQIEFLRKLQHIHDMYKPENWKEMLVNVGIVHNLNITKIENFGNENQTNSSVILMF